VSAPGPYFTDGQVSLYVGDCREVLPALGLEADLILADVPYQCTSLAWDSWPDGWLEVAATVSRSLWCFGPMRLFGGRWAEFTGAGWKFSQDVVWEKHNGSGFARDRFRRVHESVTHWYRGDWGSIRHDVPRMPGAYDLKGRTAGTRSANLTPHTGRIGAGGYADDGLRLARSVLYAKSLQRAAIHRTQKPVTGLLEHLISYACPPGGLVVSPFAGSGSDLLAARGLGCRAIGVEIDGEMCEKAARRLSRATLFGEAS
jgi:site-specific DNA-methyltransferase (adenine-specific)